MVDRVRRVVRAGGSRHAGGGVDGVVDRGRTVVVAYDRNHHQIRAGGRQGVIGQPPAGGEVGQEMAGVLAGCGDQGGEQLTTSGRTDSDRHRPLALVQTGPEQARAVLGNRPAPRVQSAADRIHPDDVRAELGGMTLAQLGADVIRVDPIGGGLDARRWPVTEDGASLFWAGLNKAKRSVAIDIRSPRGRELFTALITAPGEDAGHFLTNFPARGWLSYDTLASVRPDLVMVSIVGNHDGSSAVDYTVNPATGMPAA